MTGSVSTRCCCAIIVLTIFVGLEGNQGDQLRVGLVGGLKGTDDRRLDDQGVLISRPATPASPRHRFDLILALPRPKMLRRIFRAVAEFGVHHLHLINTARVEKSYWHSPLLHPDKINAALFAGMERSMDTILPVVSQHRRFRPFVEDQLKHLCAGRPCLIADHAGSSALSSWLANPPS